jgi:hypothetical protein
MNASALALILLVATTSIASPAAAQASPEILDQAEERIRAIYERSEFSAPAFGGLTARNDAANCKEATATTAARRDGRLRVDIALPT